MRRIFAGVLASALLASLLGCVEAPSLTSAQEYFSQSLNLQNCSVDYKCASVAAPIDWDDFAKGSIDLSVSFKPVANAKGYLFVNPGGPGASGVQMVQESLDTIGSAKIRESFNIVGFDPRGAGASAPVTCYNDSELDKFLYEDSSAPIGSKAELDEISAAAKDFAESCKANTGDVLPYIDTVSAAKDLELLRVVFGESKLNYVGYSYGTFLGTTYATLFPKSVGRLVLDGAIDPNVSDEEQSLAQLKGFDLALSNYLADCIENVSDCPFTGSVESSLNRISKLLLRLETRPLATDSDRFLTSAAGTTGIYLALYSDSSWQYLTQAFNEIFNYHDGTTMLKLADFYNSRDENGHYTDNTLVANIAINCLDSRSDASDEARLAQNAKIMAASPTFGRYWQNGALFCAAWPYPAAKRPSSYAASGAPTIMVVGTTGDPATPYQQSVALAHDVLDKGFLVTFKGEGHTAYGRSNDCVANAVDEFLLSGTLPATEPTC